MYQGTEFDQLLKDKDVEKDLDYLSGKAKVLFEAIASNNYDQFVGLLNK